MTTRWIIGLASGSSVDGVDACLLETQGAGLELKVRPLHCLHQPFSVDLRDLILQVRSRSSAEVRQVSLLHRLLGETFAAAARQVADRASFSLQKVQCLGCPGHTIWHEPEGRFPSTLGLGMPAVVAERTGVTTISDFRSRDLAVGGQGVPLTALVDYLLFRNSSENRVLLHLGGLARIVNLPAAGRIQDVTGFEAGPCNVLLDGMIRKLTGGRESFDSGGKHAVQGRCIEPLLERWLSQPYLQRRPPKSIGRHEFGDEFIEQTVQAAQQMGWSLHDLLCTSTHFVARSIAVSLRRYVPALSSSSRILLSGGGVRNGLLWHLLEQHLKNVVLQKTDQFAIPCDFRKPIAFGILAALTVDGVPGNAPAATGASGARILGSITPGYSHNWSKCVAWMAAQTAPPAWDHPSEE